MKERKKFKKFIVFRQNVYINLRWAAMLLSFRTIALLQGSTSISITIQHPTYLPVQSARKYTQLLYYVVQKLLIE
jgi:hypothetical protein